MIRKKIDLIVCDLACFYEIIMYENRRFMIGFSNGQWFEMLLFYALSMNDVVYINVFTKRVGIGE